MARSAYVVQFGFLCVCLAIPWRALRLRIPELLTAEDAKSAAKVAEKTERSQKMYHCL